jgi:hypothetical protein
MEFGIVSSSNIKNCLERWIGWGNKEGGLFIYQ